MAVAKQGGGGQPEGGPQGSQAGFVRNPVNQDAAAWARPESVLVAPEPLGEHRRRLDEALAGRDLSEPELVIVDGHEAAE